MGKQIADAVGAKIISGGYSYGEYDISVIVEAPDEVAMAAVALAIAAGRAVKAAKTTPLLSGSQWVAALKWARHPDASIAAQEVVHSSSPFLMVLLHAMAAVSVLWLALSSVCAFAESPLLLRVPSWQTAGKADATRLARLGWSIDRIAENWVVQAFDAVGLAAFSVIGVIVAVESGASPLWLWGPLLAMLTGAGVGIMRDVIRADPNMPSLKGEFYAEVALIWGFLFSLFLSWYASRLYSDPKHIFISVVVILAGAFLTRMGAIYFRIRSPLY